MIRSITTSKPTKIKKIISALLIAAFWICVWWAAAAALDKEIVLPTPDKVVAALWEMGGTAKFWDAVLASFRRIVIGFLMGVATGVTLAALSSVVLVVGRLLSPVISVMRAAPVASFTILTMMWVKSDDLPTILSAVMVMPMLYSATTHAIGNIDVKLVEMGRTFGLSQWRIFYFIKVRSLIPHVMAAAASALGFAWKAGIAAEVICRPKLALGSQLYDAKIYLEMPTVFAVTAVTVVLSILLEMLLKKVTAAARLKKGGEKDGN